MYDYGNARVAVLRGRLLDASGFRQLGDADSPAAFLGALERLDDWRPVLRETEPLFGEPQAAIEAAIEHHRSARLGAIVPWYDGSARLLVEALVMSIDAERILAMIRRRAGGASASAVGRSVVAGAILDAASLGALARTPTLSGLVRGLASTGLLPRVETRAIIAGVEAHRGQRWLEDRLTAAFDVARGERAGGGGPDALHVRSVLEAERAERAIVARELLDAGPGTAWLVERAASLARLDRQASRGPRDPLGIGAVVGYVSAVEAQAIRLRAVLTRIVAGWGPEVVAPYLARTRA
jgi:vacuolar-type H+-ATPase subunit C/Vma6